MKIKIRIIIIAILGIVGIGWYWFSSESIPIIVVSDIDLGNFIPGQDIEKVIQIENHGSGELFINDIKMCCGLKMIGEFPPKIPANSSDIIIIQLKKMPSDPFPFTKSFFILSNDPVKPNKEVLIKGKCDLPIYAVPSLVDFKYMIAGNSINEACKFILTDQEHKEFNIVTSSPNIKVSSPRIISSIMVNNIEYITYAIDIHVAEETPRGLLKEYLFVKTGIPERSYIVVPVTGIIEKGLRVQPEQIFFGVVSGESVIKRIIRLEAIGPGSNWDSFKVKSLDLLGISIDISRKDENNFELTVTLDPTKVPEKLKSNVTLENSSGDTIQIPVIAMHLK